MLLFLIGSFFGKFDLLQERILKLESNLSTKADWVISTGNLGVWPDPMKAGRSIKKHGGAGDFPRYYLNSTSFLRPTLFVAGKHEDHTWLDLKRSRQEMILLPNLHWLVNGYSTVLRGATESISIVGLGKVFSPIVFNSPDCKFTEGKYLRSEVERACSQGPMDLVLAHQGPIGAQFNAIKSNSEGLNKITFATRPKLFVHGSYNVSKQYAAPQTRVESISLANFEILPIEWDGRRFQYDQPLIS